MTRFRSIFFLVSFLFIAGIVKSQDVYAKLSTIDVKRDFSAVAKTVREDYASDHRRAGFNYNKAIQLLKRNGKKDQAYLLVYLTGSREYELGDTASGFSKMREAYAHFRSEKNEFIAVKAARRMAELYSSNNQDEKAMSLYFEAVKDFESDVHSRFLLYSNIAEQFKSQNNPVKSMEYFRKASEAYALLPEKDDEAENKLNLNNRYIGVLYRNNKQYDSAEKYFLRASKGADRMNNIQHKSSILNSLATMYMETGRLGEAKGAYLKSLELKRQLKNRGAIAVTLNNLVEIYMLEKDYKSALQCMKEADTITQNLTDKTQRLTFLKQSKIYYTATGDQANLVKVLQEMTDMQELLYKAEAQEQMAKMEAVYQNDKKSKEINAANLKNETLQKDIAYKDRERTIFLVGSIILLVLLFFAIRMYVEVRKGNKLLSNKNTVIQRQKTVVESQNKEIIDSINYAQTIQQAILPGEQEMSRLLGDCFLFFKPKDIVSGDFYWCCEKGGYTFYATVDCTGHGVPGGFMSMLATSLLAEIIIEKSILEPAEILNQLKVRIINSLKQKGVSGENKDGMDMSLCRIDKSINELVIAAANNPVWILRNGEMTVIPADKMPVGYSPSTEAFTQKIVALSKNDIIYTFTDGFADQFGGPNGKKFKYRQMMEFLVHISGETMSVQKQRVSDKFYDWKGSLDQVDDVCLIGLKI